MSKHQQRQLRKTMLRYEQALLSGEITQAEYDGFLDAIGRAAHACR